MNPKMSARNIARARFNQWLFKTPGGRSYSEATLKMAPRTVYLEASGNIPQETRDALSYLDGRYTADVPDERKIFVGGVYAPDHIEKFFVL